MSAIASNLQAVRQRIDAACRAAGRNPGSVQLLAVSKTWPHSAVQLALEAGQTAFGENYVQESLAKIRQLSNCGIEWHFIGPLQSNKTRQVAENFAWVHGIDRLKIAERLAAQRPENLPPLQVCVEVNVSGEQSKSGCNPEEVVTLCQAISALPRLQLRGLMAIPAPEVDFSAQRLPFRRLKEIFEQLCTGGLALDTLSMGMSHDLEAAITEGATIVRVGTAIFGARDQP
ncbi:MAG: hypothetical protein H6R18_1282 [Proteobacteria bacterium]|nr:hypothetical protein [Pseudomonadota bacterium]